MNILYVYAHPNAASFNAVLKQQAIDVINQQAWPLKISDLYQEQFTAVATWDDFQADPNTLPPQYFLAQQMAYQQHQLAADIQPEIAKLAWADHIIFQFPLWWFSTPAILKGWFDRVLVKGFAYDTGKIFHDGLLQGKTASLVVTTQSPESAYQMDGLHHAKVDVFLHHIHHTLQFVGIRTLPPFIIHGVFSLEQSREEKILADYRQYLQQLVHN